MRKIRYAVAMSLDGQIAGPNGEYDWIGADAEVGPALVGWRRDARLHGTGLVALDHPAGIGHHLARGQYQWL